MALALSVKLGGKVLVGGEEIVVTEIKGMNVSLLAQEKEFTVSDLERKEVLPQVWISTAKSKSTEGGTRLVFEAPRDIKIYRVQKNGENQ